MAKIRFSPKGGANNNCSKLLAKTLIALVSAFSLASVSISLEIDGSKRRL